MLYFRNFVYELNMSTLHLENRNIGIHCKNVIELRRHWQTSKKIFKYSRNHDNFFFFSFSHVNKGNIGRRLTCSCTFHPFPLLQLISYQKITVDVLLQYIDLAKPKSGARIFFPRASQGHNALPRPGIEPTSSDSEPSALTTGLLTKPWRWRARGTVDHAC